MTTEDAVSLEAQSGGTEVTSNPERAGAMPPGLRRIGWTVLLACLLVVPSRASAQTGDGWTVDLFPLYFWATSLSGDLEAGPATVPIDLNFSQAAENLGGAFSFHFEARRGRWGTLADLNFIRLQTDAEFSIANRPVAGNLELDNIMFEAGASYLISDPVQLALIGGLRTYTLSPKIGLSTGSGSATPVHATLTSPNAFVGVTLRPRLSDRWRFVSRADIGGGDARLTWSAEAGLDFHFKPWGSVVFGYKALNIDVEYEDQVVRKYDVMHQGPFVAMGVHWGRR